jgi:hypothetical protein
MFPFHGACRLPPFHFIWRSGRGGYAIISNLFFYSALGVAALKIGLLQLMKRSMRVAKTKEKRIICHPIIEKIEHRKNAKNQP